MMDDIRTVVNDPNWLIDRYDPQHDSFHLRRVSRAEHDRSTFLTDEYLPHDAPRLVLKRLDVIAALAGHTAAPLHFILHSAFCGSTLLAKAFDCPGASTAFKEPVVFNDLIGWRQRGASLPVWTTVTRDILAAIARPFEHQETVVAKMSNVVTAMAPELLDASPSSKAILMYAPLETFLTSVAKKGMEGRLWVRTLFAGLIREGVTELGYDGASLFGQTDLQIAALGWLVQQRMFEQLIAGPLAERLRSLRSDRFLQDPASVSAEAAKFFGIIPAMDEPVGSKNTSIFNRHSKTGSAFGLGERTMEYQRAREVHGEEITRVVIWAEQVAAHNQIELDLAQSL